MNIKHKISKIVLALFILVILLCCFALIVRGLIDADPKEKVLVFKKDLKTGTIVTPNMIDEKDEKYLASPSNTIKNINDCVGLCLIQNVYKNQYVVKDILTDKDDYISIPEVEDGNSMVTIKFDKVDSANGFLIDENQDIKLFYFPSDYTMDEKEKQLDYNNEREMDVKVLKIKDDSLYGSDEELYDKTRPKYITFECTNEDAKFILSAKDKGRFEIMVYNVVMN